MSGADGTHVGDRGAGAQEFGGARVSQRVWVAQVFGEFGGGAEAFEQLGQGALPAGLPTRV